MMFLASPHYNERPKGMLIELIVLHAISLPEHYFGQEHISDLFMGVLDHQAHNSFESLQGLRVSSHFLITRQGQVVQFVPCQKSAWHAGISEWRGRQQCNDFSLGIEMIGDEKQPFTLQQYQSCAVLCQQLQKAYPTICDITGHQHIAPSRKWDPGKQWDWVLFEKQMMLSAEHNTLVIV